MFRKHLTCLDVNRNHLVIPKQFATKYFLHSCDSGDKGLALRFEDESGNCWLIHCSDGNISQSYVKMEGWRKFIEEKQLAPGDIITFERHRTDGDRFFIGWQRQGSAAASQDGGAAVSGGGNDGSNRGLYQGHPYLEHVQGQGTNVPYQPDCSRAEISLALQCHAISGKSGTCQDQDQEKASEEKGFKAHKELPIDSRSDHNEGSTKIKSNVLVSIDGGVFSSDITDTTLVGGPVLSLIDKRLQNHCKKLNRILQMEEFLAQGKPLNKEQAELLQSKSAVSALIDELEKLRKPLTSAVSEEISPALQSHAISGKNGTCQDEEQEKASEEKESKSQKELSIDPKSDHDGSTKDVMSTECSGPSQVDQQNEGNALSLRTDLKQKDSKWKICCKNYLDKNSRLLRKKTMLELEFKRLKLSDVVYQLRASLFKRWPTFNCDSNTDLKEEDLEEENSLVDQQNEEFSLSPWEAERLGISENDNMEEVDWEKCCRKLRGSNLLLMEMLGLYQDELNVMKDLIREFPEFIGLYA